MKVFYAFLILMLGASISLTAQAPVNDNCDGLIELGVAPACPDSTFFTNVNATPTNIGFDNSPTCFNGGTTQNDVWFSFIASDTITDYTITVSGLTDGNGSDPLQNPQIAIYRGSCETDGLAELLCISADNGESSVELDALGLTPGITYFIRVNDYSASAAPNWGTFQLCVDELDPINTIDEGSSTSCTGELYDSGGPDGDYSNDENSVFTICPNQVNQCITFNLEYYNMDLQDFAASDQLNFYDSDGVNPSTLIASIGGNGFGFPTAAGGGGVCLQVQASSGCLTVEFISDANVTAEGFAGSWSCSSQACDPLEPLVVEGNVTEAQIVDFISTPQTQVTITDINCPEAAYGTFTATDQTGLGLERGILLTSGTRDWAVGPNNDGGGGNINADNMAPGDTDLDYLSELFGDSETSNDACVIEMDVFAATNELTFEYVFGSEEYPEFVNQFNDIFAFLISGPGITGDPNINNQLNIAVLPNTGEPVQINSVNNITNWQYYRNNQLSQTIQYDGLTSDFLGEKKSLTARADVIPCSTYHLKLAIADRGDFVYDSGVFVSELRGGTPQLGVNYNSNIDYLVEDCTETPDELVISLSAPAEDTVTYQIVIGGTATQNVDYSLNLPPSITFLPGQTEFTFPITPLSDLEVEPIETIIINLANDFGCGLVNYDPLTIFLHDRLLVDITTGIDTVIICQDSTRVLEVEGAGDYFWTPVNVFDDPTSSTPTASPTTSQWVYVEGQLGPCMDSDSIFLQLIDPQLDLQALDPTSICQGDSVRLVANNNLNDAGLSWMPTDGIDNPMSNSPVVSPLFTTTYTVGVNLAGCQLTESVTIDVSPFDFPDVIGDTVVCQGYPVQLSTFDFFFTDTEFAWTPSETLDDATLPDPIANPEENTEYQLIATSANGACTDTATVMITVLPADVDILEGDTLYLCLGETATLTAQTSTGSDENLLWSPYDGLLSDSTGFVVTSTPTESVTYYANFEVGACLVVDSVYVRVDSLPSVLQAMPLDTTICPGEQVTLESPIYEPQNFPIIDFEWTPGDGQLTPDSLYNIVVQPTDTTVYQRITTSGACRDTITATVNVPTIPTISILPADTTVCPGQQVAFTLFSETADLSLLEEITWMGNGLSCMDCLDPVASNANGAYNMQAMYEGCPISATPANVQNTPGPETFLLNDSICAGASIELNPNDPGQAGYSYRWTSPDIPGFISDEINPTVSPSTTTNYVLTLDNNACPPLSTNMTVTVQQLVTLTVSDDVVLCEGESVTLTATTDIPASNERYSWTFPGGSSDESSITINNLSEAVTVELVYTNDCQQIIETVEVGVASIDITSLMPSDTQLSQGQTLDIDATTAPDAPTGATYNWLELQTGEQVGDTEDISFVPTVPNNTGDTIRTYVLTVTTVEGCIAMDSLTVTLDPVDSAIPNIFTPNGDGRNDRFEVVTKGTVEVLEMRIYNRWGQVVFEGSGTNASWDGTHNGKDAPNDVYVYYVVTQEPGEEAVVRSGELTLVR